MSIQISVDPAGLTQEQREAVAGFILAYPGKACAGSCGKHTLGLEVHVDTTKAVAAVDALAAHANAAGLPAAVAGAVDVELATLQHDHESTLPESAFGKPDEAAAAFGVPPAPLPHGATAAPSIAVAAPSLTAPADTTGTTSTGTSTAPLPPASAAQTAFAPTAPVAPTTHAGGVELDKHGLPWDGRIHAGTKRKNADGSWTAKRGVDPALVATVEAELRQVMGAAPAPLAPVPTPAQPAAPVTTPTAGPASSAVAAPVPPTQAPVAPVPPAPSAPAGEVPADARQQFVGLVGRASAAIQGQKVTQAEVNQICADSGIPALPLLANRLDLVATVASRIDALIAARGQ